jgi:hypothetical protein
MNEHEVRLRITKVLESDRLIHEQVLGLEWTLPKEEQLLAELETMSEAGTVAKSSAIQSSQEGGNKSSHKGTESSGQHAAKGGKFPASKVKKVLDMVREEGQFLLDQKIRDQIAAAGSAVSDEQKSIVEVDVLLK